MSTPYHIKLSFAGKSREEIKELIEINQDTGDGIDSITGDNKVAENLIDELLGYVEYLETKLQGN